MSRTRRIIRRYKAGILAFHLLRGVSDLATVFDDIVAARCRRLSLNAPLVLL
jgi:hypothetical protein